MPRPGRDPVTGRFLPGNRIRRKHGLRATSSGEMRSRHNRAGWAARRLALALEQTGRKLPAWQLERARRWAELGIVASDAWAELEARGFPVKVDGSEKLWQVYQAAVREQGAIGKELGLTPAGEASLRGEVDAEVARREVVRLYGRGQGA